MAKLPDKIRQIAIVHAPLINSVVACCQNSELLSVLEPELKKAENNGWLELVKNIKKILAGNRNSKLLIGLDEEDAAIILAILVGLQNPEELPKLNTVNKAEYAPDAISKLIESYKNNNQEAQQLLDTMVKQMSESDGDMKILAQIIQKITKNNFDIKQHTEKMTLEGKKLVNSILENIYK
jgi:hypothetical protein